MTEYLEPDAEADGEMDISDGRSDLSSEESFQDQDATEQTPRPARMTLQRTASTMSSPSSPNLRIPARPRQLSRSLTLPRVQTQRVPEIESLQTDPALTARIRRWIIGVAIVDFDLDVGPVLSAVYPPISLTTRESHNIAFCAFPDSAQFDQGSITHSFRLRAEQAEELKCEDGFIYGYSHFTQRRDETSKRGYHQRSLVVLTHLPYTSLFTTMTLILGPLCQTHGLLMIEAACHNIATWSDPNKGHTIELGFLGSVLLASIPNSLNEQQLPPTTPSASPVDRNTLAGAIHIMATAPPLSPPPLDLFDASITHIWSIWECLLLCEPILIFGTSPAQTSQAIWWLSDILRPIPHGGDLRPYFTIHDSDYPVLVNKLPPKAGLLLGVTNPVFERSCSHWPHVLSLGRDMQQTSAAKAMVHGPQPGWKTKSHKRHISKDRAVLKQVELACRGNEQQRLEASVVLRRHFSSRTSEFLIPLSRYLNTLIPSPAEIQAAKHSFTDLSQLRLKPFNSTHFLAKLKSEGSTLPFKSNSKRRDFYEKWLRCPSFGLWLNEQERIVEGVLKENVERL